MRPEESSVDRAWDGVSRARERRRYSENGSALGCEASNRFSALCKLDRTLAGAFAPADYASGHSDEYAAASTGVTALDARIGGGFPRDNFPLATRGGFH